MDECTVKNVVNVWMVIIREDNRKTNGQTCRFRFPVSGF